MWIPLASFKVGRGYLVLSWSKQVIRNLLTRSPLRPPPAAKARQGTSAYMPSSFLTAPARRCHKQKSFQVSFQSPPLPSLDSK